MFEIVAIEQNGFKYLVGHPFYLNQKSIKRNIFSSNKITLFALHASEFYWNIGNLQRMKGRMLAKRNWRKSNIIFLWENEHLVFNSRLLHCSNTQYQFQTKSLSIPNSNSFRFLAAIKGADHRVIFWSLPFYTWRLNVYLILIKWLIANFSRLIINPSTPKQGQNFSGSRRAKWLLKYFSHYQTTMLPKSVLPNDFFQFSLKDALFLCFSV